MSVQTVLGPVPKAKLSRTLTHEHIYLEYSPYLVKPPSCLEEYLKGDITLRNVGFVQRYPYSCEVNLKFNDVDAIKHDLQLFKKHGGGTIVENTTHGLNRNASLLKSLSHETGVNIVAGTGYYLASCQSPPSLEKSVEDMYSVMRKDMTEGCEEDPTVKCGFLGEVATDVTPAEGKPFELRSIAATGELQAELQCPVSFHPGRHRDSPREIMRRFTEAGGDDSKCVMSHLDRTLTTDSELLEFADQFKCYLQQDLFGTEVLTYQFSETTQMPSDRQRIDRIRLLFDHGFSERALMSHDIHTRHRLVQYGGHGYMHIFSNILPKMLSLNFTEEDVDKITISNPAAWLAM